MADSQANFAHHRFQDLSGKRFGKWQVISYSHKHANGQSYWMCRCDCGSTNAVCGSTLKNGASKSCGCNRGEIFRAITIKHGDYGSSEHRTWIGIIERCHNPKRISYKRYGGRGVVVCEKWRASYQAFLNDMGRKPTRQHTIERIDNNKGYSPENCRWATRHEQARNKSNTPLLEYNGEWKIAKDWALEKGIKQQTLSKRLCAGWTLKDALERPIGK